MTWLHQNQPCQHRSNFLSPHRIMTRFRSALSEISRGSTGSVRTLANLGRLREAGDACAAALDRYRASTELTYLHTILLSEAGRHADAAAAARQALYLDRTMIVALHLALGSALRRTGDMDRRSLAPSPTPVALLDVMPSDAVVPASGGELVTRALRRGPRTAHTR